MQTLRSVLGVTLAYLVAAAAGMSVETWLFRDNVQGGFDARLVALLLLAASHLFAGFLAATIAGRRRLLHAGIVAGLFALVTLALLVRGSILESAWFPVTVLGVGTAAILFGGHLATSVRLRK